MYFSILAGGSGKRFWPESRKELPKQFINIIDKKTMLEHSIDRILPLAEKGNIFIIVSKYHKKIIESIIEKKYPDLNIKIIYEPIAKNTGPAVGIVTETIYKEDKNAIIVSLHSDHYIKKEAKFRNIIESGIKRVEKYNDIVLIGIRPAYPSVEYGYIEFEQKIDNVDNNDIFKVKTFKEKPDKETAKEYFKKDNYLWNSGIFIWKAERILNELKIYEPKIYESVKNIDINDPENFNEHFSKLNSIAIDNALLEKTSNISVIPADIEWNDVGSWDAVYNIRKEQNNKNNIKTDNVILHNCNGCYVKSHNNKLVSLVGVDDIVFVETDDVILVTKRSQVYQIKNLYERMENDEKYQKYI